MMSEYFLSPNARSFPVPSGLFAPEEYNDVGSFFSGALTTPLHHLSALASKLGVGDILVKDESHRWDSNSFKILGVSYAVGRLVAQGQIGKGDVVVCATEGNHGHAVARGAREHGLKARVYMSSTSVRARTEAITREGAEVVLVEGNYDDAVHLVAEDAKSNGWTVISDTSWTGYEEIPQRIMAGYTRLLEEALSQWSPEPPPDLVIVQAGVGGLTCALVSWLCHRYGSLRPFTIVCEPTSSACLLESARAGQPTSLQGPFHTIMAGLRCGVVSPLAWPTINSAVDAFVSIEDEQCKAAMRMLAHPMGDDPPIPAGASGACGLAAFLTIHGDEELRRVREASGVSNQSRILMINTEGVTDPELYFEVIGEV